MCTTPSPRPASGSFTCPPLRRWLATLGCALALHGLPTAAQAHGAERASEASSLALSLPIALVAAAPLALLSAGGVLTVVAVQASAEGTVWVLERASDGARVVLRVTGRALGASVVVVGAAVSVTLLSAGALLHSGGTVLCLVPNALGLSLLHNEQLTF